jgi:prepilin-type processing-associated H-X9-DG protein
MLLPSLSTAREKARQVVCASNLKQIGLAVFMYAQDNSDILPPDTQEGFANPFWCYLVWYTLSDSPTGDNSKQKLFFCPAYKEAKFTTNEGFSYGHNALYLSYTDPDPDQWVRISKVSNPSETIMVADSGAPNRGWPTRIEPVNAGRSISALHKGGANVLFVDGHVRWHSYNEVGTLQLHSNPGDLDLFWWDIDK